VIEKNVGEVACSHSFSMLSNQANSANESRGEIYWETFPHNQDSDTEKTTALLPPCEARMSHRYLVTSLITTKNVERELLK
jgi:hypothetical protein